MQRRPLLLMAFILAALGAHDRAVQTQSGNESGTIIVAINGFRNAAGHARVALFNGNSGFPESESGAFRKTVASIHDGLVEVRFDDVPFGDYAVSMYHDENDDGKLNKGVFGVPKEGYGVSNNVVHGMRAPRFEEARFRFEVSAQAIAITPHY